MINERTTLCLTQSGKKVNPKISPQQSTPSIRGHCQQATLINVFVVQGKGGIGKHTPKPLNA